VPKKEYRDFTLKIESLNDGKGYRASVNGTAGGDGSETFRRDELPFEFAARPAAASASRHLGQLGVVFTPLDPPDVETAKTYGSALFKAAIRESVRDALMLTQDRARKEKSVLRIRLNLSDVPELAALPWEYLHKPGSGTNPGSFLAYDNYPDTVIVRYLNLDQEIDETTVTDPLRVLVMVSKPQDAAQLQVDLEWEQLKNAVSELDAQGLVKLKQLEAAELKALEQELKAASDAAKPYHIFHFIGHGLYDSQTGEGKLLFEEAGRGKLESSEVLGPLLRRHGLRMAVINACEGARTSKESSYTGLAPALFRVARIPAVIAMQCKITDRAAIAFARYFYSELAAGQPVDLALTSTRLKMFTDRHQVEWATPVLYMRTENSYLFAPEPAGGAMSASVAPLAPEPAGLCFVLRVEKVDDTTWRVRVEREGAQGPPLAERFIRRVIAGGEVFPQPPTGEVGAMDVQLPHYLLSSTANAREIFDVYARVASGQPWAGEVEAFGRYLFATLIGDEVWEMIRHEAGTEPFELALAWAASEWELHRLPWEMMHSGAGFLAAERGRGAIRRIVAGAESSSAGQGGISVRPRVLFVVGGDSSDQRVRPGAEFFGLLQRLKDEEQDLALNPLLLRRATKNRLKTEMRRFQPSVVHFTCHGGVDSAGKAYLELPVENPANPPERLYSGDLLGVLRTQQGLPPVVVLNASATAMQPRAPRAESLAVELAQGGVPVVAEMAGRVGDAACRLFAWRFYEALLKGESVVRAAAHGRRAGLRRPGAHPEQSPEWALPKIYLREGVSPWMMRDDEWVERARQRERCAREFRSLKRPPLFCDREDLIEAYRELMSDQSRKTVMAVEAEAYQVGVTNPQFGKTRLLEELAAQAVRDGHVPCLVTFKKDETPPSTLIGIARRILAAVRTARLHLTLNNPVEYELLRLIDVIENQLPRDALSASVREELKWAGAESGKVVGAALRVDLSALLSDSREKLKDETLKLIVLIDEAHRLDSATGALVGEVINSDGLGTEAVPVPVIIAFTGGATIKQEYSAAVGQLRHFIENNESYVILKKLEAFPPPKNDGLIYQQFLLHQEPPLVIRSQGVQPQMIEEMLDEFHLNTKGIPSRLLSDEMQVAIRMAKRLQVLEEANDRQILEQQE
jgi:CHAT domain-containing protein